MNRSIGLGKKVAKRRWTVAVFFQCELRCLIGMHCSSREQWHPVAMRAIRDGEPMQRACANRLIEN
jgi:hypothetical protein